MHFWVPLSSRSDMRQCSLCVKLVAITSLVPFPLENHAFGITYFAKLWLCGGLTQGLNCACEVRLPLSNTVLGTAALITLRAHVLYIQNRAYLGGGGCVICGPCPPPF